MATKARKRTAKQPRTTTTAQTAGERIKGAWAGTLDTLSAAQENLEKQVRSLLQKNKISTRDAASLLKDVRALAERQRKKATRRLQAGVAQLQARVGKERRVLGRMVDEAVHSALAAFNIPSRQEVASLTRKVEELSKKIDRLRR